MTSETTQSNETTQPTETTQPPETTKPTETTQPPETTKPTETTQSSENRDTIYIGKKPLMAYVTSTLIQLANIPSVHIKARGMSIGRAVDVAQIISRKTEQAGYEIGSIEIGSETLESRDGKTRNVSTIAIQVKRK